MVFTGNYRQCNCFSFLLNAAEFNNKNDIAPLDDTFFLSKNSEILHPTACLIYLMRGKYHVNQW